jgi:hypothetical protein
MINENDFEEVYIERQTTIDHNSESSEESDIEHDKRRLVLPFYDAVSDSADLRQVINPFHAETCTNHPEDSTFTPASSNVSSRAGNSTDGIIPYNNVIFRPQKLSGIIPAAQMRTKNSKSFDIFLAITTAFLNTLLAISLDDIKSKGSQQMLQFMKKPENLHLPKNPQKVIEYKGWRNTAGTFLNAYGSKLAIFKSRKWTWEIKMTPTILTACLHRMMQA